MTKRDEQMDHAAERAQEILMAMEAAEVDGRWLDSLGTYVGHEVDKALEDFSSDERTLVLFGSSLAMELVCLWAGNRGIRQTRQSTR